MKEIRKEYIRVRRLELNLSLNDLSKLTGVPRSCLYNLENGYYKKLSLPNMIRLSSVLGIDLFKLVDVDENFIVISKYFYDIFVGKYIKPKIYE